MRPPCGSRGQCQSEFRITIFDERSRGDNSKPRLERVVVAGERIGNARYLAPATCVFFMCIKIIDSAPLPGR